MHLRSGRIFNPLLTPIKSKMSNVPQTNDTSVIADTSSEVNRQQTSNSVRSPVNPFNLPVKQASSLASNSFSPLNDDGDDDEPSINLFSQFSSSNAKLKYFLPRGKVENQINDLAKAIKM